MQTRPYNQRKHIPFWCKEHVIREKNLNEKQIDIM